MRKTLPPASPADTVRWPPQSSTIPRAMASPRPSPSAFVVKKASKICARLVSGMPGPLSATATAIRSPRSATVTVTRGAGASPTASRAFCSRLTRTCSSRGPSRQNGEVRVRGFHREHDPALAGSRLHEFEARCQDLRQEHGLAASGGARGRNPSAARQARDALGEARRSHSRCSAASSTRPRRTRMAVLSA